MNYLSAIFEFLEGKKTYLVAFITATIALTQAIWPEFVVPEFVYVLLGAAGLGAIRAGIPPKTPPQP
jgi:hypothetical protein